MRWHPRAMRARRQAPAGADREGRELTRPRGRRGLGRLRWGESPGQSMALVAVLMSALLLIPAAITAMAIGEISTAHQSVAHNSAYAAAEAGLTAYVDAANNNNPGFLTYNAGAKGTTNSGGSQPSPVSAAWGGDGSETWEPVTGSTTECYFYETTSSSSTKVTVTVTGRSGPPNAGCGPAISGKIYSYKTISATLLLENAQTDSYLYTNEYNVANPYVYGGFSGGVNECGYYAYGYNNNWGYVFFGFTFTLGTGSDWVPFEGDYDSGPGNDNNGLADNDESWGDVYSANWGTISGSGSVGGSTGPSELGTIFSSGGGWDFGDEIIAAPGFGVDMPSVPGAPGYPKGAPFDMNSSLANSAYFTGSVGTNTFSFGGDTASGAGGPNGCQIWGTPYHDGFFTNSYNFNGEGASPKVYSTDAYYVCPPYPSGAAFNTSMNNGALGATVWQSGDRWGNSPPPVPGGESSPSAINWSLWGFTLFGISATNNHYNGSPYYEPADTGSFDLTVFGSPSTVNGIQICGSPNYSAMPSVSLTPTIDPPYTTPIGLSSNPDYTLSVVRNQAACVYSGNVIFTFVSSGGASVNLNGGGVVSGSGCTGTANPPDGIFFVENGVPEVQGVVNGSFTVASAATTASTASLPGSPVFPYPVESATVTNSVTNDTGNGAYGGFSGFSDTIPNGSILVIGNLTYNGCSGSAPFTGCNNYLGLLAQNNVVVNYPTVTPLGEGTDTDQYWTVNENDINYDSDNDASYQCQPGNNCGGDPVDGPGKYGSSSDGYWQCDHWNCGGTYGFFGPTDPTDGDDYCSVNDWWGCTAHAEGSDTDQGYCTVGGGNCNSTPNGDLSDLENDWAYSGSRGGPSGCPSGYPTGNDGGGCDGYWTPDAAPGHNDGDSDDTATSTSVEMHDGTGFVHTIDADIDAVWGSFYLDKYGYWSNADHSCQVSMMYLGVTNLQNEPSDDAVNSGNGGCASDGDGDEGTIGSLTVNGAVTEFWRGILNHYEAYAGGFTISGGYSTINWNYDTRFMSHLPPAMIGPGGNQWQSTTVLTTNPVCPTGTVNTASGQENTTSCP